MQHELSMARMTWPTLFAVFAMAASGHTRADDPPPAKQAEKADASNAIRVPSRVEGVLAERQPPIRVGDKVEKGQIIGAIESALAHNFVAIAEAKLQAAKAEVEAAEKIVEETKERHRSSERLFKGGNDGNSAIAKGDYRASLLLHETKLAELKKATVLAKIAELELKQAHIRLLMHDMRSPISGVVLKIMKHPGEATAALETVFVIGVPKEK